MIVQETVTINGKNFIRSYSDKGVLIHGGEPEGNYSEAMDPAELNRTYTETDIPADEDNPSGELDPATVVDELEAIL